MLLQGQVFGKVKGETNARRFIAAPTVRQALRLSMMCAERSPRFLVMVSIPTRRMLIWIWHWHTAYAGDAAIDHYEVWREGVKVANFPRTPQISKTPYLFTDNYSNISPKQYVVKVVDKKNRIAQSETLML